MGSKNDQNFIAFCNELRAYVEEHHLFPDKHTRLSHKVKYTRKIHPTIGAGSIVTKDIPANEVRAGNPARFIRKRELG